MRHVTLLIAVCSTLLLAEGIFAAEEVAWVHKPALTFDAGTKQYHVTFELNSPRDVEVAILNADQSKVVRRLAAGMLGAKAPPPLVSNSLAQKIVWDGKDDYGQPVPNASKLNVRVRVGMSVALEQIVGGDPYAFYSDEMEDSDHSPWAINGLVAKGKHVYVWGHSSNLGPPALRQYDIDGNYQQTLFPMPAGRDVETMKGWGINIKPDGTYAPKFNTLVDPSLTTTFMDTNLRLARMLATPDEDRLVFMRLGLKAGSFELMQMNIDGSIAADRAKQMLGPLVKNPAFKLGPITPGNHVVHSMPGPAFVAYAPDGKSFYLSGIYAAKTRYGTILEVQNDGFWRDGQVWKVDAKTGHAKVFFSLDKKTIPLSVKERNRAYAGSTSYAAIHGVTVDSAGNVFVCDRLNHRVIVLDDQGIQLRQLSVDHPDALAVSKKTGALYVTTRAGQYHRHLKLRLLKFNDWKKDDKPAEAIEVKRGGHSVPQQHSYVVVCDTEKGSNVWIAHAQTPVRVYRDEGKGLTLLKDYFRVKDAQRALGFDRMQVDAVNDEVYVSDGHDSLWKVGDWKKPRFVKVPIRTADIAIDARRRHLYGRTQQDGSSSNSVGKVARFHLDRYQPANFGNTGTNRVTGKMMYQWCFEGNSDNGLAIATNGNLAVVGAAKDGLRVFAGSESKVPWQDLKIADLPPNAGGVRFDLAGNLYVGYVDKKPATKVPGFERDRFMNYVGRIHKFSPTGSLASGNLFPKPPAGPSKTYDVPYGAFQTQCVTRSPRFGVDGFGRIYFPTNILPCVTVIDNAGNEILRFGTYGNRDSMGGLPGDRVPTQDIPLAFPNSVDATDNHIYVADMVNLRVLRLKKQFKLTGWSR